MTEILFYHLERAKLEQVLPGLLEKSLLRNWKALVLTGHSEHLPDLDNDLWTYRDDSFLPHALSEQSAQPATEKILLTGSEKQVSHPPNNANILFLVEGAIVAPEDMRNYERCVVIFDGRDDEALGEARSFWKKIKDHNPNQEDGAGTKFSPTYWRQSANGKWEKQG